MLINLCDFRHQSKKRRPFSRYTARPDRVRREKSLGADDGGGGGSAGTDGNLEQQLLELRGSIHTIQAQNTAIKRNMDIVKG